MAEKKRYGEVEYNAETAVNIFVDVIQDQSGKTYKSMSSALIFFRVFSVQHAHRLA